MNPAAFSVRNPLLINLFTCLALVMGIYSVFNIQKEAFPPISYDLVTIATDFPGATPAVVEKFVTIKIEDEIKTVDGIDEMTSVSTENFSMIVLQLDPDYSERDEVVTDIQKAVDRVRDLPPDLPENPLVTEIKAKNIPVIMVSLSGLPYRELYHQAKYLEDKLLNLRQVASVRRLGFFDPEIWVEVDPEKAKLYHLSLSEVMERLKERNVNVSGGEIRTRKGERLIRTDGEFQTPQEIKTVILRSNDQGHVVRVQDIAEVNDAFEDADQLFRTDGKESINLLVLKRGSGDILKLVEEVKGTAVKFGEISPEGLQIDTVDDLSYYVKRRLRVLINNGTQGAVLILLFLFLLLSPQIAATAALDIPVTFMATVTVLLACGMTMNLMTMFGMIMVIGMLVDDAIIMAENIHHHIEKGSDPHQAAIDGAREVMKPVTAAVLTSMAAYLPLMFMTGIIGKFVRPIPIVVMIALTISWVDTLFAVPTHAAEFTRLTAKFKRGKDRHWFDPIRNGYLNILRKAIDRRYWVALGVTAFVLLTLYMAIFHMKFVLFSAEGIDEFFVRAKVSVGSSLDETYEKMKPVEEQVALLPEGEFQNFITEVGIHREFAGDPQTEYGTHYAQIHVYLTPSSDRKRNAHEITEELAKRLEVIGGFEKLYVDKVQPGPPVGKAVDAKIRGDDFESIKQVAGLFKSFLREQKGVENIQDDLNVGKDEVRIDVNHSEAARARLNLNDIASEIRNTFEGGVATTIQRSDEEIDVRVKFPDSFKHSVESVELVQIPNDRGNLIPLTRVAAFVVEPGISNIKRFDRKRIVTVTADVVEDITTSIEVNRALIEEFKDVAMRFPGIDVVYGGEQERTRESLLSLLRAFVLSIFLIFLIIAVQFRSLIQPPIVMLTIPLGVVGVIWAFFVHGQPLGFLALMGLIGLSGVVVNDSIVLIDFMNRYRRQGMDRRTSILEACRMRFRAVILASFTTVLGTLPIAYGWGGADPFLKPMALALSWGLAFSTSITLFVIPCFYSIVDDAVHLILHRGMIEVNLTQVD
jgi:multidrug efflux pump subunit AcrB